MSPLPDTRPFAQPICLLLDRIEILIADAAETNRARRRSELGFPICFCQSCGAPISEGKLCSCCLRAPPVVK